MISIHEITLVEMGTRSKSKAESQRRAGKRVKREWCRHSPVRWLKR